MLFISKINDKNILNALFSSVPIIEFDNFGTILRANSKFLDLFGYKENELIGKHHKIFCSTEYSNSIDYRNFLKDLGEGKVFQGTFPRINKYGEVLFIEGTYIPVKNNHGKIIKIIKIGHDVTQKELELQNSSSFLSSIDHSMIRITFNVDGTVKNANDNFLLVMGYKINEIIGKHHKTFCFKEDCSVDYDDFWHSLRNGSFQKGLFRRKKKNGEEILLEATYTPIFNYQGEVVEIVKIAQDVTLREVKNLLINNVVQEVIPISQHNNDESIQVKNISLENYKTINELTYLIQDGSTKVKDMKEISKKINLITKTISEISFKTNLLAINAAVEAARAGEYGRGFSVVAQEVRSLATTTSEQAKEINDIVKNLIETSNLAVKSLDLCLEESDKTLEINQRSISALDSLIQGNHKIYELVNKLKE